LKSGTKRDSYERNARELAFRTPERPNRHEGDDSADMKRDTITLPSRVAGSGTLDRLIETAQGYARAAAAENTLKAYAKDWAHFARWCRMRGADPLPPRRS
jgi:hypothetical protein